MVQMWVLTVFAVIRVSIFLAEFHQCKHCGSFLKKHNIDEYVQLFVMVANSAELRSFLLTICILVPESTRNSSLSEALWRAHFSAGEKNVALCENECVCGWLNVLCSSALTLEPRVRG